jgi:multidrug efflux system membrane fusion protein
MQAEGQLARDESLLRNAKRDLVRYKLLLSQDSIAEQQVPTQESLVQQYEGAVKTDQGQIANSPIRELLHRYRGVSVCDWWTRET